MVNQQTIEQYRQIFGSEKMKELWREFKEDATQRLQHTNLQDKESIRLTFHTLRSSSKVFGLDDFADFCHEIEEEVICRALSIALVKKAATAQKLFEQACKEAENLI